MLCCDGPPTVLHSSNLPWLGKAMLQDALLAVRSAMPSTGLRVRGSYIMQLQQPHSWSLLTQGWKSCTREP